MELVLIVLIIAGYYAYKEFLKAEKIKNLSNIQGITPEDIIRVIHECEE